jgi:hypothetical protein
MNLEIVLTGLILLGALVFAVRRLAPKEKDCGCGHCADKRKPVRHYEIKSKIEEKEKP